MVLFLTFLKGMLIGLGIAAPVGPIAFLCIKTTLAHGRAAGIATGAGAAAADTFYALVGVFGIALLADFIMLYTVPIRIVGGAFLIYLGCSTFFSGVTHNQTGVKPLDARLIKDFMTTFFLTITNPITIFSFGAVFALLGINAHNNILGAFLIVAGVFVGSLLWWLFLSSVVSLMKGQIKDKTLQRANAVVGLFIAGFGILALISVL